MSRQQRDLPKAERGGDDVLARRIQSVGRFLGYPEKRGNGLLAAMTAMSRSNDPYLANRNACHEVGQWLGAQVAEFLRPDQRIHLRGLHYLMVGAACVFKPNGELYQNTKYDWLWLKDVAGPARSLGYVPDRRFVDERNEPPRIYDVIDDDGNVVTSWAPRRAVLHTGTGIYVPELRNLLPGVRFDDGGTPRQPFRIVMIGEKTSLTEVLEPIARQKAAELLMPSGDLSSSQLYDMAWRAVRDGRPLACLYYSDFDPSGFNMPGSVARKLQALIDRDFPELRVQGVYPVALTLSQCLEHGLPELVIKDDEKRKGAWIARWSRAQTEVDALAALRPGVLRTIALEALKPFYDDTLAARQEALEEEYEDAIRKWLRQNKTAEADLAEITAARQTIEEATARTRSRARARCRCAGNRHQPGPLLPEG